MAKKKKTKSTKPVKKGGKKAEKAKKTARKKAKKAATGREMLSTSMSMTAAAAYNELDVIRIILAVANLSHISPTRPGIKKKRLYDNLNYTDDILDSLQIELDRYIKSLNPNLSVSDSDISDCETVQDVLDVMEEKLA